ncbi:MAG: hypothetical protein R3283_06620 [Balneolaceae bacterium]|nr:hypothetical protein [Balneolaceae bacterium]
MGKLLSAILVLLTVDLFINTSVYAQRQNSSVMDVRVEVVEGLSVERVDQNHQSATTSKDLQYASFSLRAARDTKMLISASENIEVHTAKERLRMGGKMALKKLSNGAINLSFTANSSSESIGQGILKGTQSLTIEYI